MKDTIKTYLPQVIQEVNHRLSVLKTVVDWVSFSTKLKSELISNIVETSFSIVVPNAVDPKKDAEPDLYIDGHALELKTSKTTTTWRGGEFSKRNSDYLLIAWEEINNEFKWFVCWTHLTEDDWKSSKSSSYYATTIDINDVLLKKETEILLGETKQKRIKKHIKF